MLCVQAIKKMQNTQASGSDRFRLVWSWGNLNYSCKLLTLTQTPAPYSNIMCNKTVCMNMYSRLSKGLRYAWMIWVLLL